jgi:hypothetical protein
LPWWLPYLDVILGQANEVLVGQLLSGGGKLIQRLATQLGTGHSQLVVPETALEHLSNVLVCCSYRNDTQNACCLPLHDGMCDYLQGCANVLLYQSLELAMKHD